MTLVVVDTNILCGSPWLRRRDWLSLLENREAWEVRVVVPEVVFLETVNVVRRNWAEESAKLASVKAGMFGLKEQQQSMIEEIARRSGEYEQWLRDRLSELGVPIVPTPQFGWIEVARRASERRAPYCEREVDGLRDTLIWLAVMSLAEENADEKVWFVSDNHRDFGDVGKNISPKEACPFPLHPDLVDDLDGKELSGRVEYVVKMDRLVRKFESLFESITEAELARRTSEFDLNVLADLFVVSLAGLDVDPELAALPLQTVDARAVDAEKTIEGWRFSDGAGRGETGWTVRFSVTTEIDLALLGDGLSSSTVTKQLRVSGDILISPDDELQSVEVTSVEALPDDPMRARWQRRAERAAMPNPFAQYAASDMFKNSIADMAAQYATIEGFKSPIADFAAQHAASDMFKNSFADMAAQYATIEGFKSPIADFAAQHAASDMFKNS
ncbi:PIN domain-containing protein, partial [Nocardia salmonicida]|uniref:PIN domain-containing protein n=1 Tax=Nocardia salmonicida TaxID=53431 RepID=UPI00364C5973